MAKNGNEHAKPRENIFLQIGWIQVHCLCICVFADWTGWCPYNEKPLHWNCANVRLLLWLWHLADWILMVCLPSPNGGTLKVDVSILMSWNCSKHSQLFNVDLHFVNAIRSICWFRYFSGRLDYAIEVNWNGINEAMKCLSRPLKVKTQIQFL